MTELCATVPFAKSEPDMPETEVEVMADEVGLQINIMRDGMCEWVVTLSPNLILHVSKSHIPRNEVLVECELDQSTVHIGGREEKK